MIHVITNLINAHSEHGYKLTMAPTYRPSNNANIAGMATHKHPANVICILLDSW